MRFAPPFAELRRNCDEPVSVDKINVTDYQCAYACYEAQNKCESSDPSNVSACFSLAKDDDPVLKQCSIPLGKFMWIICSNFWPVIECVSPYDLEYCILATSF